MADQNNPPSVKMLKQLFEQLSEQDGDKSKGILIPEVCIDSIKETKDGFQSIIDLIQDQLDAYRKAKSTHQYLIDRMVHNLEHFMMVTKQDYNDSLDELCDLIRDSWSTDTLDSEMTKWGDEMEAYCCRSVDELRMMMDNHTMMLKMADQNRKSS